jgi:hypothetical protein
MTTDYDSTGRSGGSSTFIENLVRCIQTEVETDSTYEQCCLELHCHPGCILVHRLFSALDVVKISRDWGLRHFVVVTVIYLERSGAATLNICRRTEAMFGL